MGGHPFRNPAHLGLGLLSRCCGNSFFAACWLSFDSCRDRKVFVKARQSWLEVRRACTPHTSECLSKGNTLIKRLQKSVLNHSQNKEAEVWTFLIGSSTWAAEWQAQMLSFAGIRMNEYATASDVEVKLKDKLQATHAVRQTPPLLQQPFKAVSCTCGTSRCCGCRTSLTPQGGEVLLVKTEL